MTCQGTHVWIKAPCGATVGVCDGLVHRFARMRLRDGDDGGDDNKAKTLYSGGGALGLSSMVKAPPSRRSAEEEDADACADPSLDRRRCGFKRRTVAHFSADGVSGQVWAKKPFWRSVAAEPVGDGRALEADARAAFAEAGLALLPAATDAAGVPVGNALEGGEYTCDGHKSWPGLSTTAPATAPPVDAAADRAALLAVEERWLAAITSGDRATVEAILAPAYRHINADGVLIDRDEELAGTAPLPVVFNLGEPLIDIVGDTAVLRGINTITQDGSVVDCQRFTDVFIRVGSEWKTLAAQETRLAPEVCAAPAP